MVHLFKKSAVVAAAVLACVGAQATTVDWGAHDPLGEDAYGQVANGIFSDYYTFSVASASTITGVVVSNNNLPGYGIGLGSFGLFKAADPLTAIYYVPYSGSSGDAQFSANIAAGDYFYQVIGTAGGVKGGRYTITSNVAAVPEPETYALLLGGLGVVGFVAARRRVGA